MDITRLIPSCIGGSADEVGVAPEGLEPRQGGAQLDKKGDVIGGVVETS